MKRIVILALGSRGDVQPFVALGKGLRAAGYAVRLLASAEFAPLAAQHGLDFAPVEGDMQATVQSELGRDMVARARNPLTLARMMRDAAYPVARQAARDAWEAATDADLLLLAGPGSWIGMHIIDKTGIPAAAAFLQPLMPAREYLTPLLPPAPVPLPGVVNRLSSAASMNLFWTTLRPVLNEVRREVFGLPPAPRFGIFRRYAGEPVLYGFSRHVVPRSADWPPNVHLTGYWQLDDAATYAPPDGLVDFIQAGPPPVYVGFGSMSDRDPTQTTATVVESLRRIGRRGVLLTGWGALAPADLPSDVYLLRETSHAWLLPQMAAIVHHGGAGTTGAALRAGRPTVVVPFFADQPFWAGRVYAIGAGPRPIPKRKLSSDRLAAALETALSDPDITARARRVGAALAAENGVARAVSVLSRLKALQ